jgi:hypothetical protein
VIRNAFLLHLKELRQNYLHLKYLDKMKWKAVSSRPSRLDRDN